MAKSEYINNFSAGQLSPLLNAGTDLEIYRRGCKTLRNFYVKPQGAAERRQGTHYLTPASSDNSRLIAFIFSRDESYMIEVASDVIRLLDGDGSILTSMESPFDLEDIPYIKTTQISDIMWMVTPNKPPYKLSRTSISPAEFQIDLVDFIYPPFLEENVVENDSLEPLPLDFDSTLDYGITEQVCFGLVPYSDKSQAYTAIAEVTAGSAFNPAQWTELSQPAVRAVKDSTVKLYSVGGIFKPEMSDSYFRLSHQRANDTLIASNRLVSNSLHNWTTPEVFIGSKLSTISTDTNNPSTLGSINEIYHKEGINGAWVLIYSVENGSNTWTYQGTGDSYLRATFSRTSIEGSEPNWSVSIDLGKTIEFISSVDTEKLSESLDVSFSNWEFKSSDTWTGSIDIEKSIDGGASWEILTHVIDTLGLDTTAGATSNVKITSPAKEGANTLIRINYDRRSGTLKANLTNLTTYSEGLFRCVEYIDEMYMVVEVINPPLTTYSTFRWSEGAFSTYRGFPTAIALYQNRLVYSGTIAEPSTVYLSYVDDYNNFLLGTNSSEPIKVTPTTAEPCLWLLSKNDLLYQGTRGSIVVYSAYDSKPITPLNISARESLEFGGSYIQAVKSNETVLFLERSGGKLRETHFSDEEKSLVSKDLTILSNEISSPYGFTDLIVQKTPDQIIYGLRSDGLVAGLTYERSEDIFGWGVFDFGGEVLSIGVRPTLDHDELWIIVKRPNGTFIEKTGNRIFHDDLKDSWFVDSGVEAVNASFTDSIVTIGDYPDHKVTISSPFQIQNETAIDISNVRTFDGINNTTFTTLNATPTGFDIAYAGTETLVNGVLDFMPEIITVDEVEYTLNGYNATGYPIFSDGGTRTVEGNVTKSYGDDIQISGSSFIQSVASDGGLNTMGHFITPDGTRLLEVYSVNDDDIFTGMRGYYLSTPFNISTKAATPYFIDVISNCNGFTFSPDGLRMLSTQAWTDGLDKGDYREFVLNTPWDTTNKTQTVGIYLGYQTPHNIQWSNDGNYFAIAVRYNANTSVDVYHVNTPWSLESGKIFTYSFDFLAAWDDSGRFVISEDGLTLLTSANDTITQYDLQGYWDVTNATVVDSKSGFPTMSSLFTQNDKIYLTSDESVNEYDLGGTSSSKWDWSDGNTTLGYNNSFEFYPPTDNWEKSAISELVTYTGGYSDPIYADVAYISNKWAGLDHLEGQEVQVIGDGAYAGTYTVLNGEIETYETYNQALIGLRYLSILQPMYIESGTFGSNRYNKAILDASIMFYRSGTGWSGMLIQGDDRDPEMDFDYLNENFPNVDTVKYEMEPLTLRTYNDIIGQPLKPFTGSKLVNYNDTYSRVKSQFIIIDTPEPMTVQAMAVSLAVGGD